jgi:tRNA pseudouridine38-40 synthase
MLKNFKLVIEYDGTDFHGWQVQPDRRSIQGTIQTALSVMTASSVLVIGSGRTDAGVHARAQVANFRCETAITTSGFRDGLNSLLPDDVAILSFHEVDASFHARFDVRRKQYAYRIINRSVPAAIDRRFVWQVRRPLHLGAMQRAVGYVVGRHDFKAFEGAGSPRAHTRRTVYSATLRREGPDGLIFTIEADGFLRYMVRNLMGTLVEVGLEKRDPGEMPAILRARDRSRAGPTAPPQGLCLMAVMY